jgi:acetoin utilization deacetylase AcuC-like enzyme
MSRLALVHAREFQLHATPQFHPESPQRLAAINEALEKCGLLERLARITPEPAAISDLTAVHSHSYLKAVEATARQAASAGEQIALDADTWVSGKSYEIARLAAGAGIKATDAVLSGTYRHAFLIVRPPGHHALPETAMGFCLINNVAVAARHAQRNKGLKKIMIIDFDVHHGNGTQEIFYEDPGVLFLSLQQFPFWPPNSGWYADDGAGAGRGYNINIPLPEGTGDRGYLSAFDLIVSPVCMNYRPELILLSAGFDAHKHDPLAGQQVSTGGFRLLAGRIADLAENLSVPVVGFLEGGYDERALSDCLVATLQALDGQDTIETAQGLENTAAAATALSADQCPLLVEERLNEIRLHFSAYWSCF